MGSCSMLLISILILSLLAVLNYSLGAKALFHPAVVYSASWAGGLTILLLARDWFYSLSDKTLLIFVGGAVAFSLGSGIAFLFPQPRREGATGPLSFRFINVLLIVLGCGAPFAVIWMFRQVEAHPAGNFFVSASLTMLDDGVQGSLGYSLFANCVTLANLIALVVFCEKKRYKRTWWAVIAVTLVLNALTAGRAGFVTLVFALVCLDWFKDQRVHWKVFASFGLIFALAVVGLAVFLGKATASTEASVSENATPVIRGVALYAAGSLVAFDQVVRDPNVVPHTWKISAPIAHIWHRFDPQVKETDSDTQYVGVGPYDLEINTYTGYFAYIDFGYLGMMSLTLLMGFLISLAYRKALTGSKTWQIMYAALFAGLPLSLYGEYFFRGFNVLSKLYLLLCLVYWLPGAWYAGSRLLRRSIERDLAPYRTGTP